jgi:hypothetical protein
VFFCLFVGCVGCVCSHAALLTLGEIGAIDLQKRALGPRSLTC